MTRWIVAFLLILTAEFSVVAQTATSPAAKPPLGQKPAPKSDESLPSDFDAVVISVTDANWIETEREGKHVSLRLYGILCPDRKTLVGVAASQDLGRLLYGKFVHVKRVGFSAYGGLLAIVSYEKTMINESLLSKGWAEARAFLDLPEINDHYKDLENDARAKGVGIWYRPGATVQVKN